MKTMAITVEDAAREAMERLALAQGRGLDDLISRAVAELAAFGAQHVPAEEERRRKLWERIDACNVEVGNCPTRARTYDHRRFHRY